MPFCPLAPKKGIWCWALFHAYNHIWHILISILFNKSQSLFFLYLNNHALFSKIKGTCGARLIYIKCDITENNSVFFSVSHQNASVRKGNGNTVISWCMEITHMMIIKPPQLLSKWDLCCFLQWVYRRVTRLVMTHQMGPRWIKTVSP